MRNRARRISEVAGWTFASRLLGLVRDILLFASLGTGTLNSAFILAFTFPNLFRRLLGEGALASSAIPVLSESLEREGREAAFRLLNGILFRLGMALVLLQLLAFPAFLAVSRISGLSERWYLGAELSLVLFPYVIVICLGALVCGMLNVLSRFGVAAFNQVWLNLAMIGSLVAGLAFFQGEGTGRVWLLSAAVLAGGMLQLLVPSGALAREGWNPLRGGADRNDLRKVLRLFLPGLLGAAIFQINILVSRFLAFSLDETATGLLYLAGRLVELPLGVFAIAITTVVFPELSRLSAIRDEGSFAKIYTHGLVLILSITLPASLGLILMAGPILGSLFEWGLFDSADVSAAVPVLMVAATGLPFFAWSNLLTRAWYARQEMRIPVILAAVSLVLNLVLGLLLMGPFGAPGLALANTLSSMVHCIGLQFLLPGRSLEATGWRTPLTLLLALLVMTAAAYPASGLLRQAGLEGKAFDLTAVIFLIPLLAILYLLVLRALRYAPLIDFLGRDRFLKRG